MKLQVSFDITDLTKALTVAHSIESHVDIFEVGALLIYKYGEHAVRRFKEAFPQKTILADAKIIDRSKDAATLFAAAGADWITIMAGAGSPVIHTACTVAHSLGKKIMLDLADSTSFGQSALEAKSLGVSALVFHKPSAEDGQMSFLEQWDLVKGNTQLPVFISAHVTRDTIDSVLSLGAAGIIIGSAIVNASNPKDEAAHFAELLGGK